MANKSKAPMPNLPQALSDSSSDEDGALIYTPPETELNDSPSSSSYLPDTSFLNGVIQGLQNVDLAQDTASESVDIFTPLGNMDERRNGAERIAPSDIALSEIAVNNATDALQNLAVSDRQADDFEQVRVNVRAAKNGRIKEEQQRKKSERAEENAEEGTNVTSTRRKSYYIILRDAGYRGMEHFMESHGLNPIDPKEVDIAREMVESLRKGAEVNSFNSHTGAARGQDEGRKLEEEIDPKEISNYKWLKNSGWGGIKQFMIGHGYKWGDLDDHLAAKDLIERLKEDQASEKPAEADSSKSENSQRTSKAKDTSNKKKTSKAKINAAETKVAKTKKATVVGLWEDYFGNETQLENWQRLCVDVGMEEIPTSITQCRKVRGADFPFNPVVMLTYDRL